MPPLRERREDISLLANYFISLYSKKCKRKVMGLTEKARSLLQRYDWPGNVRELENAIESAVVLGNSETITVDDLPERLFQNTADEPSNAATFYQAVVEAKKRLLLDAITQANGNYTQAAKALSIHPNNLHRLVRTLGLKPQLK
jgi:Nif-specific regulatory protein